MRACVVFRIIMESGSFYLLIGFASSLSPERIKISLAPYHISFQPAGQRAGKEEVIHFPHLPDKLSFSFPRPSVLRLELRQIYAPSSKRRLRIVVLILGSHLKRVGTFHLKTDRTAGEVPAASASSSHQLQQIIFWNKLRCYVHFSGIVFKIF